MADRKETVILDFKVNGQDATVSIDNLTKANKELREERKKLDLQTEEGIKRANEINTAIDRNTNVIKANSSALEKQRMNVGNYTDSIKNAAKEVNIAGVNVGSLTTKMTALINPVTAAAGVVGAAAGVVGLLGAAYAHSTTGAKDLEFAQNELGIATDLLSEKFAKMISSSEDGQGAISKQVTGFFNNITTFANAFGANSTFGKDIEHSALVMERMQDLQREETKILAANADRRADNAELQTKILDSHTSYNEKLKLSDQILANAKKSQEDLVRIKQQELNGAKFQLSLKADEKLQERVGQAELALASARKQTARDIKQAEVSKSNIIDANTKIVEQEQAINEELKARSKMMQQIFGDQRADDNAGKLDDVGKLNDIEAAKFDLILSFDKKKTDAFVKAEKERTRIAKLEEQARFQNANAAFGAIVGLFEQGTSAYKVATLAKLSIDTAAAISSLTAMSEANPANAFTFGGAGIAQYAVGLVRIFANIAQATEILGSFSEGGYTGSGGKYQPAGIVHAGEVVWNQSDVAAVGGPARANAMRPSYAEGGIVAQGMTRGMNMSSKQMQPIVYLSYKEFAEFQEQTVKYKENMVTA